MNIVYWGSTLPLVLEQVSRETSRGSPKPRVYLQMDPGLKTLDYASHYFDEVVRQPASNLESLEILLKARSQKPFVVLDLWALLFEPSLEKIFPRISAALGHAGHVLVLMPRAWVGRWRNHAIYKNSNPEQRSFMEFAFARALLVFEELWNCPAPITCIEHAPTFDLIEGISGHKNLAPQRNFGLFFLPPDCRNHQAQFSTTTGLVKAVLNFLGVLSPGQPQENETWLVPVVSEKSYSASSSSHAESDASKPWYVFPRSWGNYATAKAESGDNLRRLLNSNRPEFLNPHLFAQWFYFLGVLEKENAQAL